MSPFTSACMLDQLSVVDQFDDQAAKRGGILDILPSLFEDRAQHPRLPAQFFEDLPVVPFQFFAVAFEQTGPAKFRGDDRFAVVRRPGLFVGHFQKEQKRNLLRVGHIRKPIIPQHMGEVPGFVDDLWVLFMRC